jgi:hypothetical protein
MPDGSSIPDGRVSSRAFGRPITPSYAVATIATRNGSAIAAIPTLTSGNTPAQNHVSCPPMTSSTPRVAACSTKAQQA